MTHPTATTLRAISTEVNARFLERRQAVEGITLAVLAKEHAYILGLPGTGKSAMVRDYLSRLDGAEYFEIALSKTRPDQAILGPYDLPLLRDKGQFRRQIKGYLLTANYAFLDEVGKMSPTTGHDMLAALNERKRHEVNGEVSVHPIPLYSAITASNELIVNESEDAAALWDRLLVRIQVDTILDPGNFASLLGSAVARKGRPETRTTIPFIELADVIDNVIPRIPIPADVIDNVVKLREELRIHGISPSPRRWRQSMRLLQAAAFMAGHEQVETDDIGALRYSLWDSPEQISTVERATLKVANPLNEECMKYMDELTHIRNEVMARKGKSLAERAGFGAESFAKIKTMNGEITRLRETCKRQGRSMTRIDEVHDQLESVRQFVKVECLEMD